MITIIILVHNVAEAGETIANMTRSCVESLLSTANYQFELVLVDNGSRDYPKTFTMLTELAGTNNEFKLSAKVIRNEENTAISKCWNEVIRQTTGEQVFLVNNDIVFHRKGWMGITVEALARSGVGVVGLHGMSWNSFNFIEGSFFCFNRNLNSRLLGISDGPLFDEQFLFSCEDADLCRRVQASGMTILEEPGLSSFMQHAHHGTLGYVDREPGGSDIGGSQKPIQYVTHDMRRLLCRKWGMPEQIVD